MLTLSSAEHEDVFVDVSAEEGMNAAHLSIIAEPGAKAFLLNRDPVRPCPTPTFP